MKSKITFLFIAAFMITGISVNAQCVASFNTTQLSANTFQFTSTTIPSNPTIRTWSFGDSQYDYVNANPIHAYAAPGTYLVTLTIYDSLMNCQAGGYDTVVVTQTNGILDFSAKTNFSIAPNPSSDFLNIQTEMKAKSYTILDVTGRIIENGSFQNNQIDIRSLDKGTYLLEMKNETGEIFAGRFIKN